MNVSFFNRIAVLAKIVLMIFFCSALIACGGSKPLYKKSVSSRGSTAPVAEKAIQISNYALGFLGTKYKYGGTTKRGMDCSGLVYTSFLEKGISLPRVSRDMATRGNRIRIGQANVGDLLFFKTGKSRRRINHVGLVVEVTPRTVKFIHSSTSAGVIVSSLDEAYWNNTFVMARRVL